VPLLVLLLLLAGELLVESEAVEDEDPVELLT
jgi:hypothetical protein